MATSCEPVPEDFVDDLHGLDADTRDRIQAVAALDGDEVGRRAALILDELGVAPEALSAALVVRGYVTGRLDQRGIAALDSEAAAIAEQVARCKHLLTAARIPHFDAANSAQAENLRCLVLASTPDFRALLVLLAEWLAFVRCVREEPPEQRTRVASQTLVLYAPLANRLGIGQWKSELEDLAFRELKPQDYRRIAHFLDERLPERERYLATLRSELQQRLAEAGIEATIQARPKHIYSIWKKAQTKRLSLERLFDLRAVRILVGDIAQCYAALGVVHTLWEPIRGEFDDYIAKPKPNLYRSLHTAVVGPAGKVVEVQIRTWEMHEHAEYGVAAHWRYKEGVSHDPVLQDRLSALRRRIGGAHPDGGSGEAEPRGDVYVLTPQGDVVSLPAGATALDFAYRVHTDVGHRARGARVNGQLVQLNRELRTGDQLEILTRKEPAPSRDWLRKEAGFLRTNSARAKVRQWFHARDFDSHVAQGKELLRREIVRARRQDLATEEVAGRFGYKDEAKFLAALGRGKLTAGQLAAALAEAPARRTAAPLPAGTPETAPSGDVLVMGEDDLLTQVAGCCRPVPGDPIVGYLTKGRGITVHRQDCPNMAALPEERRERLVEVSWGASGGKYGVEMELLADDREGLLRDVANTLAYARYAIQGVQGQSKSNGAVRVRLTVAVTGQEDVERIQRLLERVSGVTRVRRTGVAG